MKILDNFILLKDVSNILNLSPTMVQSRSIKNGYDKVEKALSFVNVNHFTSEKVNKYIKKKKNLDVVYLETYPLPVSYNYDTESILINLNYFGAKDITFTNPSPRDIYGCVAYGLCLSELVRRKNFVQDRYTSIFASFLLSTFIRIYGKSYGLLGYYSDKIPRLKFVLTCYILRAFFGVKQNSDFYKTANMGIPYRGKDDLEILEKIDFSTIEGLIQALSDLEIMPGINKYQFTASLLKFLTVNFLPALEDCARFISVLTTSNIPGITFIPSFLYRYNEQEFVKILQISKELLK